MIEEENEEHNEKKLIVINSPRALDMLNQLGLELVLRLQRITKVHRSGNTDFFKSRLHEMFFYLKINDPQYDPFLGITRVHKIDVREATKLEMQYIFVFNHAQREGFDEIINFDFLYKCIDAVFFRVTGGVSE